MHAPRPRILDEGELCREFAPRIRLYGLRHLRDPHAAADLVQQVLMTLLESLRAGKIRQPERIASFVLGTCRMTVLDIRRGAARRRALLETYGAVEEAVEDTAPRPLDEARLAGCLGKLDERSRSVVLSAFVGDEPAGKTAAELGLTPGNVRVIRHRALARLRECMEGR
ncbi:MAG TPA: sigma-70 family RNA polymerase sigma factor [Burkholderiales bacterium]|nr:sigma-70 family RNA polymerase sigma factor [Burkholderiales bacterium]